MPTTCRELLNRAAFGLGAGAFHSALPPIARAQATSAGLVERVQADLERHAAFGDKFSGGPGDRATADWIAERLRGAGLVDESTFDAPFFVRRAARLTSGSSSRCCKHISARSS